MRWDDETTGPTADQVDGFAVLDTVADLPISTWAYRFDPSSRRHLGPMDEDWLAAFHFGADTEGLDIVDVNGVSLVAIQALYRRLRQVEDELRELRSRPRNREGPPTTI